MRYWLDSSRYRSILYFFRTNYYFVFNSNWLSIPNQFIGKTIREIELRAKFNLLALTTIKKTEVKSVVGKTVNKDRVQGVAKPETILEKDDILVVYGSNLDLRKFTNK